MRTELTNTFPAPLKKGFDFLHDFTMWPHWYAGMTAIIDPGTAAWDEPGDAVRFAYKLLGRRLEGVSTLEEMRPMELVRFVASVPGLPEVHQEYHYAPAGDEVFVLKVVMETGEPTSFFGRAIDRMLLPRALQRDLRRSMENLHDIFAAGLFE